MLQTVIFIFLASLAHQERYESPAMKSLVDAERAFASMSVQEGTRKAFVANFADDGISFQPHPVVYKDAVKDRPMPANPTAFTLNWQPVFGDVSESGDIGYTTGPYSFVDNSGKQPSRHGFYFSVWKRTSRTPWRVALDIGIGTPGPSKAPVSFHQGQPNKGTQTASSDSGRQELKKNIEEYLTLAATKGVVSSYEHYLAPECRVHADGSHPLVGREMIQRFLAGKELSRTGKLLFVGVSESNDLGYAYGSYANLERGKPTESGYFGHVWKRNDLGQWKLVAEILSPVPQEDH